MRLIDKSISYDDVKKYVSKHMPKKLYRYRKFDEYLVNNLSGEIFLANPRGISRNELGDIINIAPRYIASIENSGQHPSLQIFYELVTFFDISVDQFFFPNKENQVNTQRRQLDALIDEMDDSGLTILTATAKGIKEAEQDNIK